MAPRGWGYWTEAKLDILSAYLPAFTTASTKAGQTIYLDLFAGNESNERRDIARDLKGSALRALETVPALSRLYFFELKPVAAQLEQRLRARFPDRSFEVIAGDCNIEIDKVLDDIRNNNLQWVPTFAFVDPYSTHPLRWETLRKLADFKRDRKYKVELWLLFYGSGLPRVLGLDDPAQTEMVSQAFGTDDWAPIHDARQAGDLTAAEARSEYTNLMRWRIENTLGYATTHVLEVKNVSGAYLYDLIFATDNTAGDRIMRDVYKKALSRNEQMRQEAVEIRRAERSGQASLFEANVVSSFGPELDIAYVHAPPSQPYGMS